MSLIFLGFPEGSEQAEKHAAAGFPPIRNLQTSKAKGLVFPHMRPVPIGDAKQERMVLSFCQGQGIPIVRFTNDGSDTSEALLDSIYGANPELDEMTPRQQARYLMSLESKDVQHLEFAGYRTLDDTKGAKGGVGARSTKGRHEGAGQQKTTAEPVKVASRADLGPRAQEVYDASYAKNVEKHGAQKAASYASAAAKRVKE